jgi:hypothetical protein
MSLFMCRECGCVENTACCDYWSRRLDGKPIICSECDPAIGKWHGQFPKRPAAGMVVDQDGHLWRTEEGAPRHYKIVGLVSQASAQDSAAGEKS